jgi:hypothetical protein
MVLQINNPSPTPRLDFVANFVNSFGKISWSIPRIILSAVLVFSIVGIGIGLGTGMPSTHYSTKSAICSSKVLELAQMGIVRDVEGYNGAIYGCIHMHGFSSIYGSL